MAARRGARRRRAGPRWLWGGHAAILLPLRRADHARGLPASQMQPRRVTWLFVACLVGTGRAARAAHTGGRYRPADMGAVAALRPGSRHRVHPAPLSQARPDRCRLHGDLSGAAHEAARTVVRPLGGASGHPCVHHRRGLGGSHRRAELRRRVRPARARQALRGRGAGDSRGRARASLGRRPRTLCTHNQRSARRDDREGRNDRHLARGHLPLRPPSRDRRPRSVNDARDRGASVGQDPGRGPRAIRERLLLPGVIRYRERAGQSLVHRDALAGGAPHRDRRRPSRPRPAARLSGMVCEPCAAVRDHVRASPSLHRRAALGVAADVVACRLRQRGAALRPPFSVDQGTPARQGEDGRRGDRVRRRHARAAIAALGTTLLVMCNAPAAPPPASPGVGLQAAFVLANPAGLLALDAGGHAIGRIVDLPAQSAPATPVLAPPRKSLVLAPTQQPDKQTGFGSDLYAVNLDGTGYKPVVQHESDNVFYASPRFDASGNLLYFHRRAAIIQAGSFVGNEDSLERLDLRTGERKRLLMNGADPALSPDGRLIVYVHLTQGQPDGLWSANVDGSNARPFFKTKDTWWYLQAPRFSPNGCEIVFSAAGHTVASLPIGAKAGFAHLNIPSELYVAPCDGTSVKAIGQTGDDVVPAWSPDATRLAYVGTGAFFILTLATGNVRTIAQGQDFFFGDLVWLK